MRDNISQWKKRINDCPLPILKSTAQFFSRQKARPGASISGLWQQLQYDPGMCLNLLRAAGRSPRIRVTTVNHAALLLGLPNTLDRANKLPRVDDIKNPEVRFQILKQFSLAHFALKQSEQWLHIENHNNHEEILTASLMAGFIDYLICNADQERYLKLIKTECQGVARVDAEQTVLGVLRRELAYEIAQDWGLPDLISASQKHGKQQAYTIRQVYLVQRLIEEAQRGWFQDGMHDVIKSIAEFQQRDLAVVTKNIHHTSVKVSRATNDIYHPVAGLAARLIQCEPATFTQQAIPIKPKKSRRQILEATVHTLQNSPDSSYEDILNQVFYGFRSGLGLQRMFFALVTEDKRHINVKYSIDVSGREGLNRFRMPLENNNLFEQLMRQPGGVWMNKGNQKKYLRFLPKIFVEQIRSGSFFAMSVFLHDKPVALFFADSAKSGDLMENQFKYFKRICRVATEALEALSDKRQTPKIA